MMIKRQEKADDAQIVQMRRLRRQLSPDVVEVLQILERFEKQSDAE